VDGGCSATRVTDSAALDGLPLLRVTGSVDLVGLRALVASADLVAISVVVVVVVAAAVVVVDLGLPLLRLAASVAGVESDVDETVLLGARGLLSL